MKAPRSRTRIAAAVLCLALVGACTGGRVTASRTQSGVQPITVASFGFTESEILAQIYAQALRANGYPVRLLLDAGTRELVEPALAEGLVDIVPEYSGSALSFLTLGATQGTSSVADTNRALDEALRGEGAQALAPAPAQDANAIVVTRVTANRHHLAAVGDLARVSSHLVFGGPPECPQRPLCLEGLRTVYGVSFGQFVPLDAGGALTLQALRSGDIDVGLLFSTDPAIARDRLISLADPSGLQPAENVTPVVRRSVLARYGPGLVDVVNAVSARLTTAGLRHLIAEVSVDKDSIGRVAARWLKANGLT